jgi:class 3 adenylate cyclase
MQVFFDLIQEVLQRYEGTLTQFEEGRCVAVFGAPVAQEDHAQRAVLAASDLLQRLRADRAWQSSVLGAAFAVGIGLHTGSVVGHRH